MSSVSGCQYQEDNTVSPSDVLRYDTTTEQWLTTGRYNLFKILQSSSLSLTGYIRNPEQVYLLTEFKAEIENNN